MTTGFGEARFEARPGTSASTTYPGEPETREDHNTIPGGLWTRRRLAFAGGAAVALAGAGAYLLWPHDGAETDTFPDATMSPEKTKPRGDFDQVPRVFYGPDGEPLELRRDQITMPETLDPPTFAEAFANVGQAIEFYVNNGDLAGIQTVVPGTTNIDAMSPGQLYERAVFIQNWRSAYGDPISEALYKSNPENIARHYAWGFRVELLEQINELGATVAETETVTGKVRVAVGDYRPEINGHNRVSQIERPRVFEGPMTITRYANLGHNARLPKNGWGVYHMAFPPLPAVIAAHPPQGYEQTPLLYPGLGR